MGITEQAAWGRASGVTDLMGQGMKWVPFKSLGCLVCACVWAAVSATRRGVCLLTPASPTGLCR